MDLTEKQREVLALIGRGHTNAQIADQLGISLDGAKWHVREILGKLGVESREEAADLWKAQNGGVARAGRTLRGAATVIGLRWFAGATAVAVLAGGAIAVYAALHNDDSGVTPAARSATSTPAPNVTPNAAAPVASPTTTTTATAPVVIAGFSPRGLAFIREGNLWVSNLDSGGASREVQVTKSGGLSNPSWSFSGRYIAVWGFGHVWIVSSDEQLRDGGPVNNLRDVGGEVASLWSPAADVLAVAGNTVTFVAADSGTVTSTGIDAPDGISWSPDGKLLAVGGSNDYSGLAAQQRAAATARASPVPFVIGPAPALRFASPFGLAPTPRPLAGLEGTQSIAAAWSPDGRYVLCWVNATQALGAIAGGLPLYALPVDSGEPVRIGGSAVYPDFVVPKPGNSSDLVLVTGGGRFRWAEQGLAIANVPGAPLPLLLPPTGSATSPVWSADGADLAYVLAPEVDTELFGTAAKANLMSRRIWIQDASGDQPVPLVDDFHYRDERPQFVGGGILFARATGDDKISLWFAAPDGDAYVAPGRIVDGLAWPDLSELWFGDYGHIDWPALYDAWGAHHYAISGQ